MKFENCAKTINKYQYCDKEARNIVHLLTDIMQVFNLASIVISSDEVNDIVDIIWDEGFGSYVQYKTKI